jgi:hypothetical protein
MGFVFLIAISIYLNPARMITQKKFLIAVLSLLVSDVQAQTTSSDSFGTLSWIFIVLMALGALALARLSFNLRVRDFEARGQLMIKNATDQSFTALKADLETMVEKKVGFLWNDIAMNMIEKAKTDNYRAEIIKANLEELLNNSSAAISKTVKMDLADALMKYHYYSIHSDKYTQIKDVIARFDKENIKLKAETYATAALCFLNSYEYYGRKSDRDACLESCERSVDVLRDYGTAYAVKMETFMVDYEKATTENEKAVALVDINKVFKEIENNKSDYLCKEFLTRLDIDKGAFLKPYIDKLEYEFANEISRIAERANRLLVSPVTSVTEIQKPVSLKIKEIPQV